MADEVSEVLRSLASLKRRDDLSDEEKACIWKQRFFEAQASCEQFVTATFGPEGIQKWIEQNALITAQLLTAQEPRPEHRLLHFVERLSKQLWCYGSDLRVDLQENRFVLINTRCGILTYRRQAHKNGVVLTFKSPCGYCRCLNSGIARKYVPQVETHVQTLENGCIWQLWSQP